MSTNLPMLPQGQLPVHLRKSAEQVRALASELAGGVTSSFPIISYRGKVWRIRKGGEEVSYIDQNGDPVPSIEVVMVKSNKLPSKLFYEKKYEEGSNEPPRCWSTNGVNPDHAVQNPINSVCATCDMNKWGSRITEAGKKGRACSDTRRMVVAFTNELATKGADAHMFLMRIPPASLNPLKDYAEKALAPAGVEYFAVATRIGFDTSAAHPKLTFRATRYLTEEEYEIVQGLRESDDVARILTEEPDFAGAGTTGTDEASARIPQKEVSAPAPAPKQKARPVEEEEIETAEATLPPPPVPGSDEEEEDEAPPPPKKKAKKAPTPAETPAPAPPPAAGKGFDDILSALLD